LYQVGDLFELNVKLWYQNVKQQFNYLPIKQECAVVLLLYFCVSLLPKNSTHEKRSLKSTSSLATTVYAVPHTLTK
jgi:hypothetical protein